MGMLLAALLSTLTPQDPKLSGPQPGEKTSGFKVFDVGRKHGVRPRTEMTMMMVGVVTAEGIGKFLDPEVNSFQEVSNFLIPVLARRGMLTDEMMMAAANTQAQMAAASAA